MGKTYEPVDPETEALIAKVRKEHHCVLENCGVTIGALFVAKESKEGDAQPALRRHGFPVAAQIQITSLADRVRGVADAKLTIDRFVWDRLPAASRLALIDHELAHLLTVDGDDEQGRDDIGRPKLRIRPHDYELTGFTDVAERHGEASMEVRSLRAFRHEQLPLFCPDGLS